MFTGLIQQLGRVDRLAGNQLFVHASAAMDDPWVLGESVSVNGCCLTVVGSGPSLTFDLSEETLLRTTLGRLEPGHLVNIERAMKANDRFGGHIVQGHVDGIGETVAIDGSDFSFEVSAESDRYLIDKGSIAIDGISLTVIRPERGRFSVALIPHTLANTNLHSLREGDPVNVEFDVLAKHVAKLLDRG